MRRIVFMLALAMVLASSGCVWKSDFESKVMEADSLQKDKAGLQAAIIAKDKEIADLKQKIEQLTKEKAALQQQNASLQQQNADIKGALEGTKSQLAKELVDVKGQLATCLVQRNDLQSQRDQLAREKAAALEEKDRAIAQVKTTYDSLVNELKSEIKEGEIQITQLKDKLTVNMVEKVLFDSGSAVIKKNGTKVLDRVAEILKALKDRQINIEGHTDNVPISSRLADKFPSNWELATARATTVVRYLQERGVDPRFLSAEGYGEFRPVAPNDTDENKAKNRRIEIVLVPLEGSK